MLAAPGLVCWAKLRCLADVPSPVRREIAAFQYCVLHLAAQITRFARHTRRRLDRLAAAGQIAAGFRASCAAFAP